MKKPAVADSLITVGERETERAAGERGDRRRTREKINRGRRLNIKTAPYYRGRRHAALTVAGVKKTPKDLVR
jgi:hypothetical protein